MKVELNHTVIVCRDKYASARFWADILQLHIHGEFGPFVQVRTTNSVDLDFLTVTEGEDITSQHYAFLVADEVFDQGFARIKALGLQFQADPHGKQIGEIYQYEGGRGVYFSDPNGHFLEMFTRTPGYGRTDG
ncbi:VOC family protein [Natronoglycomyces albus]|uniref:VOC family protein n=1 Tax=Natronoglycomyces albus TaxID=2811108 RepID=A0A895XMS2_9ACTN|nr:VOC family protein [Natronoglycomyces albus]QSB04325.1 VOC family protein [Natronoglycomyces albus]